MCPVSASGTFSPKSWEIPFLFSPHLYPFFSSSSVEEAGLCRGGRSSFWEGEVTVCSPLAGYFTRHFRACGGCRSSLRRCHPHVPHTDHQPGSLGEGRCCTSPERRKGNEGLTLLSLHHQWRNQITNDFFKASVVCASEGCQNAPVIGLII